jgi:Putative prokaryotic signal transducing protein
MREVFVNQDHARVGFYKSVLEEAGIPNFVRNEMASNITDMPSPLFFPALCVLHDEDYDEAMQILGEIYYERPSQAADWCCSKCNEEVPGTFDSCWQCGELRAVSPTNSNEPGNA